MSHQRIFVLVDVALLSLLAVTFGLSFLELGIFTPVVHFGIAVVMADLVVWFLMELRVESGIVRVFAGSALLWLLIMFALSLNDWLTR